MTDNKEINPLHITWHDSAWIPNLNQSNVLDYFSDRTNSFYDRTCNNEIIKMQRLNPVQLNNMVGIEYILLHVQEPILYVIRKQHRHSPTQVTPIADYYVLAGVVYQAPDLNSLINSRVHSTLYHLQSAFDETYSYARYHPSKGYWWEFKDTDKDNKEKLDKNKERIKEETPATTFQRQRVDILLNELAKKFPYKTQQQPVQQANDRTQSASNSTAGDSEVKSEIKTEKNDSQNNSFANPNSNRLSGGPPEKKQKLI